MAIGDGLQLVPLLPLCRSLFTLLSQRNLPPLLYQSIQCHLEFDFRTKLAVSYSFFNPFVFLLVLPFHPLNFFFPSDLLSLFHAVILSTLLYLFKHPPLFPHWHFHSFIVFHSNLSFFLQVYYGVTSTHTYFCPSRLRSLWGCVGLTVPALPPSAGHPFPTPHMYLVSTYSLCFLISINHFVSRLPLVNTDLVVHNWRRQILRSVKTSAVITSGPGMLQSRGITHPSPCVVCSFYSPVTTRRSDTLGWIGFENGTRHWNLFRSPPNLLRLLIRVVQTIIMSEGTWLLAS